MQLEQILVMTSQFTGDFSFQASLCTHLINVKLPLSSDCKQKEISTWLRVTQPGFTRAMEKTGQACPASKYSTSSSSGQRETRTKSFEKIDRFGYICTILLNLFFFLDTPEQQWNFHSVPFGARKTSGIKVIFTAFWHVCFFTLLNIHFFLGFREGFQALKVRVR